MNSPKKRKVVASDLTPDAYTWMNPDNRDLRVIDRVKAGESQCFATLVHAWTHPVHSFFVSHGVDVREAEDLTQEVFIRAFRSLTTFDATKGAFRTWLFTIALNLNRDRARRRERRGTTIPLGDREGKLPASDDFPATTEGRDAALRMLSQLSTEDRTLVTLKIIHGFAYAEIAPIVGMPQPTIRSRVRRALRSLAERIRSDQETDE